MKTTKFSYFMPLLACALALGIFGCTKETVNAPVAEESLTSKQEVTLTTRAAGGNQMANGGGTTVEGG